MIMININYLVNNNKNNINNSSCMLMLRQQ